ncbi:MAG: hypothetical protein K2I49_00170 [Ureaplasma sp.]|nr:hypothetical protein [Ureaplasma sp.]
MKFNKKYLKTILFPISSALIIGSSVVFSSCSYTESDKHPELLTNAKVEKNFKTIWKNKTFLDANDLVNYKVIQTDAFDNLENDLEYIDISNIEIQSIYSGIKWPKVKKIKIGCRNDIKIVNNLLFIKGLNSWYANTIADRDLKMDILKFPTSYEIHGNSNNKYGVAENFYDPYIFKNINKIIFNDFDSETPIQDFRKNSFKNCDKLEGNLIFNFKNQFNLNNNNNFINYINFGISSFFNTNIDSIQINTEHTFDISAFDYDGEWLKNIFLNSDSFANNKNLSSFILEDGGVEKTSNVNLGANVFNDCEKLKNFKIYTKKIKIENGIFSNSNNLFKGSNNLENIEFIAEEANFSTNNIFSNDYESLNLSLLIDNGLYTKSSTFSGINIPNYKLNIVTYNKMSLYNSGLTTEQFYNAKQIPYTSKVLNKKMVKQNLASIWKDKKYLSTNDLNEFTHIKSDAFDDISANLEYIDISNLELISNTNSINTT